MPLKKVCSIKAFEDNISTEINSGKNRDQAIAIAYSVLREACGVPSSAKKMSPEDIVNYKKEQDMPDRIKRVSVPVKQKVVKVKYGFYTNSNGDKVKLKPGEEVEIISND